MTERPIECTHCKKAVKVIYKEIVEDSIIHAEMCADCPILEQRLHGQFAVDTDKIKAKDTNRTTPLVCETCHTSLETVKTGNPLGCSMCYTVFADVLIAGLIDASQIPLQLQKNLSAKKNQQIHIGKTLNKEPNKQVGKQPHNALAIIPSSRLTTLNEALNEAIKRENYEQAALLRDQIKALMDNPNDGKT